MLKKDRLEESKEVLETLLLLSKNDLRLGQIFEIIRAKNLEINKSKDLFNIENNELLKLINKTIPYQNLTKDNKETEELDLVTIIDSITIEDLDIEEKQLLNNNYFDLFNNCHIYNLNINDKGLQINTIELLIKDYGFTLKDDIVKSYDYLYLINGIIQGSTEMAFDKSLENQLYTIESISKNPNKPFIISKKLYLKQEPITNLEESNELKTYKITAFTDNGVDIFDKTYELDVVIKNIDFEGKEVIDFGYGASYYLSNLFNTSNNSINKDCGGKLYIDANGINFNGLGHGVFVMNKNILSLESVKNYLNKHNLTISS